MSNIVEILYGVLFRWYLILVFSVIQAITPDVSSLSSLLIYVD